MYTINIKKFQNTPRSERGIAAAGEKRLRLSDINFEDDSIPNRTRVLHPTKGWRSRSHGPIVDLEKMNPLARWFLSMGQRFGQASRG